MSVRRIGLVQPPADSIASGGDLYDQQMLRQAQQGGFPLHGVPCDAAALHEAHWDLLVWDSLLLDRVTRLADERVALLLHYLPSLEPALDPGRRVALQAMEHRALGQADFIIATGRPVVEAAVASVPGVPVFRCEPGVAEVFTRRRAPPSGRPARGRRAPWLLTVAHLLPAKGHGRLLEILQRLSALPWHWHVVGDGGRAPEAERALLAQAARAGLAERITWHGALGQGAVAGLMADSDIFVFPSTFEAYGMVLAEAAAAGLPVLTNRVGAAERLVRHGVSGYLASVGDWDAFGRYLRILLGEPELRATFGENLRRQPVRRWDEAFADFRAACDAMPG